MIDEIRRTINEIQFIIYLLWVVMPYFITETIRSASSIIKEKILLVYVFSLLLFLALLIGRKVLRVIVEITVVGFFLVLVLLAFLEFKRI